MEDFLKITGLLLSRKMANNIKLKLRSYGKIDFEIPILFFQIIDGSNDESDGGREATFRYF